MKRQLLFPAWMLVIGLLLAVLVITGVFDAHRPPSPAKSEPLLPERPYIFLVEHPTQADYDACMRSEWCMDVMSTSVLPTRAPYDPVD